MENPYRGPSVTKRKVRFEVISKRDLVSIRFNEPIYELVLKPNTAQELAIALLEFAKECRVQAAN